MHFEFTFITSLVVKHTKQKYSTYIRKLNNVHNLLQILHKHATSGVAVGAIIKNVDGLTLLTITHMMYSVFKCSNIRAPEAVIIVI